MSRIGWPTHPWHLGALLVLAWKTCVLGTPLVSGNLGCLVILWTESILAAHGVCRTELANPRVDTRQMVHYCSWPAGGVVSRTLAPLKDGCICALWPPVALGNCRPVLSEHPIFQGEPEILTLIFFSFLKMSATHLKLLKGHLWLMGCCWATSAEVELDFPVCPETRPVHLDSKC